MSPIKWENSRYNEKHRHFLSKKPQDSKFFTLCDGAVRSGKTLSIIYKIPQIFYYIGNEYLKVFSGYSRNTVRNNVLIELIPYLENYHGAKCSYNSSSGELDIKLWGKLYNCLVAGGGKADSDAKIQGGTWDFWYANELARHSYAFYNMALSRLTPANARAYADCNPESPNHWLYRERIKPYLEGDEKVREIFEYWHFSMEDNANLPPVFIENQKRLYRGAFEARKIRGLWTAPDGLVYDTFCEEKHTVSRADVVEKIKDNLFIDYFLGLDWGWNHPLCCGLYGVTKEGVYFKINELYGQKKTCEDVCTWILGLQKEYGRYFRFVNADNARPEQNYELERSLRGIRVYSEKPGLLDSIETVRGIINYDRLVINRDDCPRTVHEFKSYSYPQEDDLSDPDIPVKRDDDAMDETRYALFFYESQFGRKIFAADSAPHGNL